MDATSIKVIFLYSVKQHESLAKYAVRLRLSEQIKAPVRSNYRIVCITLLQIKNWIKNNKFVKYHAF
jgi:hypothetical protein